jgi:hypothetical protein
MRKPQGRWTDVFLAFRLTLDPRKLWLAFRGLVLSLVLIGVFLAIVAALYRACGVRVPSAAPAAGGAIEATRAFAVALVMSKPCLETVCPLVGVELILLLIWAYYGAAIMRLTAVEYALGERIELASARAWARRKHSCFYGSVLGLAAVVVLLAVGIAYVGLIAGNILAAAVLFGGLVATGVAAAVFSDRARSRWAGLAVGVVGVVVSVLVGVLLARAGVRIPYVGEIAAGLLSPLAFLAGLTIVLIVVWMVFGSALMFGTLSSSDADIFEAWSGSFHHLFTRPWLFLFLWLVLSVYGLACLGFVCAVRVGTEWAVLWPLSSGLLGEYQVVFHATGADLVGRATGGAQVLSFFLSANRLLLNLVVLSFWAAFKCTAMTILYFLMRQGADGTPVTEVHLEPRDHELIHPPPAAEQD